jgi:hypothetical protein
MATRPDVYIEIALQACFDLTPREYARKMQTGAAESHD